MPIFHAFVLGLVQGLSEFLPISSSGHLLLVPWLFGWNDFDDKSVEKAFDVALHLGTLIAVIVYLRQRGRPSTSVPGLGRSCTANARARDRKARIAWLLVLATIPAAAVGAVFQDSIDEQLGHADDHRHARSIVFGLLLGRPTACRPTRPRRRAPATPSSSVRPRCSR